MSQHHQDWEPVVLRKRATTTNKKSANDGTGTKTVLRNSSPNANATNTVKHPKNILNDSTNPDPETLPTVLMTNTNLSSAMKTARNSKIMPNGLPMTQSDLDKASQVPKNTVRDYENGSAIYCADHVNKIARTLNVTLPRPKRQTNDKQ